MIPVQGINKVVRAGSGGESVTGSVWFIGGVPKEQIGAAFDHIDLRDHRRSVLVSARAF